MPPGEGEGNGHLNGPRSSSATAQKTNSKTGKEKGKEKNAMSAKLQGVSLSFAKKHPKLTRTGKVVGAGIAGYAAVGAVNTTVRVIRGSSLKSAAKAGFGLGALEIE